MKRVSKKILAVMCSIFMLGSIVSAADEPAELNADSVEYDMNTEIITASGNVVLTRGADRATGNFGTYDFRTKVARLSGNVTMISANTKIDCDEITSTEDHVVANGNVVGIQDDKTFRGQRVDYYPNDRKHILIESGGTITSIDGTFTANRIEGWIDEGHYIGTGNANLKSPAKNLEAGGDRIDYYSTDTNAVTSANSRGLLVIEGNAWANQNNHTLRGNKLTLHIAENPNDKSSDFRIDSPGVNR